MVKIKVNLDFLFYTGEFSFLLANIIYGVFSSGVYLPFNERRFDIMKFKTFLLEMLKYLIIILSLLVIMITVIKK